MEYESPSDQTNLYALSMNRYVSGIGPVSVQIGPVALHAFVAGGALDIDPHDIILIRFYRGDDVGIQDPGAGEAVVPEPEVFLVAVVAHPVEVDGLSDVVPEHTEVVALHAGRVPRILQILGHGLQLEPPSIM